MAKCANCNKTKALGGIYSESLFFCGKKCHGEWKVLNPQLSDGAESKQTDSMLGRIAGLILAGIGVLGTIGKFMVMFRSSKFSPLSFFIPILMLAGGLALYNKCNGKTSLP